MLLDRANVITWRLAVPLACYIVWALPHATQARPKHPKGHSAISERIEEMIGTDMRGWCEQKGVAYPPDKVLFRVFKMEREIEIWALSEGMTSMQLVTTVPVCSMDFLPGPKLKQGDSKTPEGFYHISRDSFSSRSGYYWMWVCLNEASIDNPGEEGNCSCLKICLEYPNDVDNARSKVGLGIGDPGDGICIHGNCITAGCVSFENRDLLPVYGFAALHHRKRNEDIQFHIFPFRFKDQDLETVAIDPAIKAKLGEVKTRRFWRNLKLGYDLFETSKLPLRVQTMIKLQAGSVGQTVKQLQQVLKEMGHFAGEVNGLFDQATVDAVKVFQKARKLKPTGRIRKNEINQLQMYWYEATETRQAVSRLAAITHDEAFSLPDRKCQKLVAQVHSHEHSNDLMAVALPGPHANDRERQVSLWLLGQAGLEASAMAPLMTALVANRQRSDDAFDDTVAAACYALSKVGDDVQIEAAVETAKQLSGPTQLWCSWILAKDRPKSAAGDLLTIATAELTNRLSNSAAREAGLEEGRRTAPDRQLSTEFRRLLSGLIRAGEPALPILRAALLQTVAVSARSGRRGRVSSRLCSALVANAGSRALPSLEDAMGKARAYALGHSCVRALVELSLEFRPEETDLRSLVTGRDTGRWAIDSLVAAGSRALPVVSRALSVAPSTDEDASIYTALGIAIRLGRTARPLRDKIARLRSSEDSMVAERATEAMRALRGRGETNTESNSDYPSLKGIGDKRNEVTRRLDPCSLAK